MHTVYALMEFNADEWLKASAVATRREAFTLSRKLRESLRLKVKVTMIVDGDGPDTVPNLGKDGPIHNFSSKAKEIWRRRQRQMQA